MRLSNVFIEDRSGACDIYIAGDTIASIAKAGPEQSLPNPGLFFDNAIAIPGLINSHDHLDFNLFPSLGNRCYQDYREWAQFIHHVYKIEIAEVLAVPDELRVQWGLYKNLLCGVTTVVNHGMPLRCDGAMIDVFQNCQSLHSVGFEKFWQLKLNNPLRLRIPVAIHVGEGVNSRSSREIDRLLSANIIGRALVGIHGVGMNAAQARKLEALVWCPASNYFMFNQTADIRSFKDKTTILFGSDSTLTSDWNILQHIHLARRENALSDEELFRALTTSPAAIWGMSKVGRIHQNYYADIVVADQKSKRGLDAALSIAPKSILLVMKKGSVQLFDETLLAQMLLLQGDIKEFSCVLIEGQVKYVRGNIGQLIERIRFYYPKASLPVKIVEPKEQLNAYTS